MEAQVHLRRGQAQVKTYAYALDDALTSVAYTNANVATPTVSYTYDTMYPRLATMVDGLGTTTYTYHPVGSDGARQVASIDGPRTNDTLTYTYDELGRITHRALNSVGVTWAYDAQSRLTSETVCAPVSGPQGTFGRAMRHYGVGSYRLDLHPTTRQRAYVDISSWPFQIPLGGLIPIRVENLLPAARNIGVTHITMAAIACTRSSGILGRRLGRSPPNCLATGLTPRQVRNTATHLADFQRILMSVLVRGHQLAQSAGHRALGRNIAHDDLPAQDSDTG